MLFLHLIFSAVIITVHLILEYASQVNIT